MVHVWAFGNAPGVDELVRSAHELQDTYCFSVAPAPQTIPLQVTSRRCESVFSVSHAGVKISEWQSGGICTYASLPRGHYLLSLAMLGLLRYRALQCNPLLQTEDLTHDVPATCIYARQLFAEEYALRFERPELCRACRHFYTSLCPREEVEALEQVLLRRELVAGG